MDVTQYLEIFLDETKEHLQSLSDQFMILEQEQTTWIPSMKYSVPHIP